LADDDLKLTRARNRYAELALRLRSVFVSLCPVVATHLYRNNSSIFDDHGRKLSLAPCITIVEDQSAIAWLQECDRQ
jgi:hypothetical protein